MFLSVTAGWGACFVFLRCGRACVIGAWRVARCGAVSLLRRSNGLPSPQVVDLPLTRLQWFQVRLGARNVYPFAAARRTRG